MCEFIFVITSLQGSIVKVHLQMPTRKIWLRMTYSWHLCALLVAQVMLDLRSFREEIENPFVNQS